MPVPTEQTFRRHERVIADIDLDGVPRGTSGRVMYVAGVTWIRYRIKFDNGVERSGLDGRHLVSVDDWEAREAEERRSERQAQQQRLADELRAEIADNQAAAVDH